MKLPDLDKITAETTFIFGIDTARLLRILVAQNQKGGPLTQEEMEFEATRATAELMPQILEVSGAPAAQPRADGGKGTGE